MQGELNIFISLTNFINMAKYIKKEIADLNGKGTTQAYYRLKTWRKLDSEEFAERCHSLHPSFSKGLISGVLDAVVDQLAYEISNGFSVKIDGVRCVLYPFRRKKCPEMELRKSQMVYRQAGESLGRVSDHSSGRAEIFRRRKKRRVPLQCLPQLPLYDAGRTGKMGAELLSARLRRFPEYRTFRLADTGRIRAVIKGRDPRFPDISDPAPPRQAAG